MRWKQFWFIVLWVMVIGVRMWLTLSQEFWEDELWSLYYGVSPESYVQMLVQPPDDRPPVYHMFVRLMVELNIQGNWLRVPSLLAGIITLWLLYRKTHRVSELWGVTTVLAAGASLVLIDASWQMREYAFLGLVAALQIGMWLEWQRGFESRRGVKVQRLPDFHWWRNWSMLSFIGVALSYVYLPFLAAMLLSWLMLLVWDWTRQRLSGLQVAQYSLALCVTSIPTGLMAAVYLFSAQLAKITTTTTWIPQPTILSVTSLVATLSNWHNYLWEYRGAFPEEQQRLLLMIIFWIVCFGVTQWLLWQQQRAALLRFNWWALGVLLLNIGSVVYASCFLNVSVFLPRFFTPLAAVSALIWATSLVALDGVFQPQFRNVMRWLGLLAGGLIFLVFFSQVYKLGGFSVSSELSLSKLTQSIKHSYRPGDQLVFLPEHYQKIMPLYYFPAVDYSGADAIFHQYNDSVVSVAEPAQSVWTGKQLFLVVANLLIDPNSDFYEPDGYEASNLAKLDRYRSLCSESNPVLVIGSEYSFFKCVLR